MLMLKRRSVLCAYLGAAISLPGLASVTSADTSPAPVAPDTTRLRFARSDWNPRLLRMALEASENPQSLAFVDALELPAIPVGADLDAELAHLLRLQARRTWADVNHTSLGLLRQSQDPIGYLLEAVLGVGLHMKDRAGLNALANQVEPLILLTKLTFSRSRPSAVNGRIIPAMPVPGHPSFPSGHAAQAYVCAEALALRYPNQADKARQAGRALGDGRELAGLHFPSDTVAGRQLGFEFFERFSKSGNFGR